MIPERLPAAEWLERSETQQIFAALDGAEGTTRAVGGIVRDTLMGRLRPDSDIDMATELLPVAVMQRAKAHGIAAYPTGIEHGTVTLRLNETSVEVTTLRRDVETDGRHAQVQFGTDWTEDAKRRDFTMNALYCGSDGALFDPLGGAGDALNGRVRFIGQATERIAEDGLRVFRFFRFTASHGGERLDPEGLAACQDAAGRLDHISAERVGAEMWRMLGLAKVALTLAVMSEIGLLALSREILAALVRYEALGGAGAAARLSIVAGGDLDAFQERWRLSNAAVDTAKRIAAAASLASADQIARAVYAFREDAIEALAVAAARENWPRERLMESARELGRLPDPTMPVSGKDLLDSGIKAGPEVGKTLARLETLWIESGFSLSKDELLAQI
ncbi:CCA tRNA nucleotidyltransferase [Devosia sp. Leaf420]|uniref:CCA tRNA nucleotidyltransferase n=1 Tax=Devosia sp. Leaf420 TaxID=1736374 RepID=UPI0009EAB358|nr:CCA tRNA nucleotidyltransferase [Devosia sp. Leaf420]